MRSHGRPERTHWWYRGLRDLPLPLAPINWLLAMVLRAKNAANGIGLRFPRGSSVFAMGRKV